MNPALKKRCAAIQAWLAQAASDDVLARHRVGQLLLDTRNKEQVYGAHPVAQLSLALRRPVSTLYRYASVAERWSADAIEGLARRPNAHGEPLSWSHWVELAQVRSPEVQERLLERALAESLSVRELAEAARGATNGEEVRAGALEDVARSCERWSGQALEAAKAMASRWKASGRDDPQLLATLQRAMRAHEAVRARNEEALGVLRAALGGAGSGPRLIAGMRP